MMDDALARAARLPCWTGPVEPEILKGGITNANFLVRNRGDRYVVRIAGDVPTHGIMRFNELAASRAAHAAGLSPEVVYAETGAIVLRYIDGRTLTAELVREPAMLERIVTLVKRCHMEVPRHLRGPALFFWVFHVVRDYAASLRDLQSPHVDRLPALIDCAERLERMVGAIDVVYGHNDLLAGNLIDDGTRLWLIDWDYAGFNTPLFDLGGLASNNELTDEQEKWLLERYFGRRDADLVRRFMAMRCASLLRESLWSMVSERISTIDFDYAAYTQTNLARFTAAYAALGGRA
jgi:thiamine kinase-like enzyme